MMLQDANEVAVNPAVSANVEAMCQPEKKTICFCNCNAAWGGGEKWHFEAAKALAKKGWKIHLICLKGSPLHARAIQDGSFSVFPVVVGKISFLNPLKFFSAANYLKEHAIDSIIVNLPSDLKLFGMAAKWAGVPHIIYRRGSDIPVKNSFSNRYLYKNIITKLIANSNATAEAVVKNNPLLISKNNITVLYNGIDAESFDSSFSLGEPLKYVTQRAQNTAEAKPIVIGNAGRLTYQKGQYLLLHLGKLLDQQAIPFQLVIAGEGECEADLKSLARSLNIHDRVIFTGFMENLSSFWKSIDIFFLSSLWEGFGFVLVEAMLAKKPLVAFHVSNIPELITQGENGIMLSLPEDDNMEEALTVIKKLKDNPTLCEQMGEKGRKKAVENFSHAASMEKLERLLLGNTP